MRRSARSSRLGRRGIGAIAFSFLALWTLGGFLAATQAGRGSPFGELNPASATENAPIAYSIVAGKSLFFTVAGALWVSDGTGVGTRPLAAAEGLTSVSFLAVLGDIVLFGAADSAHGWELWRSNGTNEGTRFLRDIYPGPTGSGIERVTFFRGQLYFSADDGVHGRELWKTDGTPEGTVLAADLNPGPGGTALSGLAASGDLLYFTESTHELGKASFVYVSDGTESGTRLLHQFANENTAPYCFDFCYGWAPGSFRFLNGWTYFIASDGMRGLELWRTDGTSARTNLVKDIYPGQGSGFRFSYDFNALGSALFPIVKGQLCFFADDGVHGIELWTSDGTEAGTWMVKDVDNGSLGSNETGLTSAPLDSSFLFSTWVGYWEMWRSDGTEAGTFPIGFGTAYSDGEEAVAIGNDIYFRAPKVSGDFRLWRTDSAGARASLVSEAVFNPSGLVELGRMLYFTAPASEGFALWKTDGTSKGTSVVRILAPSPRQNPRPVRQLPFRRCPLGSRCT